MAKIERHLMGPDGEGGKSGHMHMTFYPTKFNHAGASGDFSLNGTGIVLFVDGEEGHFHIDVEEEILSILVVDADAPIPVVLG